MIPLNLCPYWVYFCINLPYSPGQQSIFLSYLVISKLFLEVTEGCIWPNVEDIIFKVIFLYNVDPVGCNKRNISVVC